MDWSFRAGKQKRVLPLAVLIILGVEVLVEFATSVLANSTPSAFERIADPVLTVLISIPLVFWLVVTPLRRIGMESQAVLHYAMDGFFAISVQGCFLEVNDAYCSMIGYTRDELLAMRLSDIEAAESPETNTAHIAAVMRGGSDRFVSRHHRKDGAVLDVEISTHYLPLNGGRLFVFVRDITERKRAEATLDESEQRYRRLFEANPFPMWVYDPDTLAFLEVNDAAVANYGYGRDEFLAMTIADIRPVEDVFRVQGRIANLDLDGMEMGSVWKHRKKDGSIIDVEISAHSIDHGGRRARLVLARNITDRRQAMEALMASEAYLRAIMNNVPHLMWLKDANGRFLAVNNSFVRSCGRGTAEEVIGKTDLDVWPADLANKYRSDDALVMATREQQVIEEAIAEAGGIKWFETYKIPILADGEVIGTTGVAQDITERRAGEVFRRLHSAALHAAGDAIVITDRAGVIEWVNPAFTKLTGYTAEEALGETPGKLIGSGKHPPAFFKEFWETILAGRTWLGEMINRRKDGTLWTERQSVTPIPDASGSITHFVAIKRDLTNQLQLEAQFRQAQKMESVGQLTSGIAHDFNNLLTVINGMSELVLRQVDEDNPVHADVQEIHRAGERAARLTSQLLAFSRQQILQPRVLKVSTAVAAMADLLRRLLGEDIDLAVMSTPDAGSVKADPGQLEQVLTNLAVNARDAMPKGGQLTIETQNVTVDEHDALQHGENIPPGSYVQLTVSDTGVGMDEATRERIFEPFFTTKGPGKGTGLGLSTVYGIVKQSQGFIGVYSEVGYGTSVRIYLPQVTETVDTDRPTPTTVSSSGTETILVVEDNDGLRKLATRVLERAGYTVLGTATGEEALLLLARHEVPIQLLLSDVVMPGMSGRRLAQELAQSQPGMKMLYMSGYTSDTVVRHGVLQARVPFLHKPFTASELLRKVREVLDS